MTDFLRTPDANFVGLRDFDFTPRYHQWQDLRVHYLDEGPADGPVMLLVHGMPTWSYLYRHMLPVLVAAGYRCIAPDHLGFGRSDKPTDPHFFTIARHTEVLTSLLCALELTDITLVCQDWGGPIGLAQAMTMPERFSRLVVMNTWLHHEAYPYSDAVRSWNQNWHEGGLFHRPRPDVGLLPVLTAGLVSPEVALGALAEGRTPPLDPEAAALHAAYSAPFAGMEDAAFSGARRFPLSIPFDDYASGNGAAQSHHRHELARWTKPVHFLWGTADPIFPVEQGRAWAEELGANFDEIDGASHFLQDSHGTAIAERILEHARRTPEAR